MKIVPNYKRGVRYFYASKVSMACAIIFQTDKSKDWPITLHSRQKDAGADSHRVCLEIIRTKAEAAALERKWKRKKQELIRSSRAFVKGGAK